MEWEPLYFVIAVNNGGGNYNLTSRTGQLFNSASADDQIGILQECRRMIDRQIEAIEKAKQETK